MQVEGGRFVDKKCHFGKYLRWVDQIPKFFYQSFLGCMAKDDKKNLVPGLARPAGPGCKVAKVEPSLVENLKMTIFMYVMSKNHNCLRVICMPYGSKKIF